MYVKTQREPAQADILKNQIWRTHYDYNDAVRRVFEELSGKSHEVGVRFAELFIENPKDVDLAKLAAQALEEEEKRQRFSKNEAVEAAHTSMKEISEDAAAEFRRVVGVMGQDANLRQITKKIREQYSVRGAEAALPDPFDMTEDQVIRELREMGYTIIAPVGGPYPVQRRFLGPDPAARPRNLHELQAYLLDTRKSLGKR